MKLITYYLSFFLIFTICQGQRSNRLLAQNNSFVRPGYYNCADAMGNVKMYEKDGTRKILNISRSDTFPIFTGFPVFAAGYSFEGGIVCNLDSDPEFEIAYNIGSSVRAWNYDGTFVQGWPQPLLHLAQGAPAFGDIDGDGQNEIVVTDRAGATSGGNIYAFHRDGTVVSGFPVNHGFSVNTPVLENIDNSGGLEIIVNKYESREIWVYSGNGTVYPGWPKSIESVPASSAAVGDINNDGYAEIIAESLYYLYVWDRNGNLLPGFPFKLPGSYINSNASPVLADLNGDNTKEIIFAAHDSGGDSGKVFVLYNNGNKFPGWPKATPNWLGGPPAVGYIDSDNILDIAVGEGAFTISEIPIFSLFAWNANGNLLPGFPVTGLNSVYNQVTIADVDNDNLPELIIDDNSITSSIGKYLGFNHDGTPLTNGWPVYLYGSSIRSNPIIWDVNLDGILDIAGSGNSSFASTRVYLWNTQITYNYSKITIPMWQYNSRHNGVYGDIDVIGIKPVSNKIPESFQLKQNYPNPFNPVTHIGFRIPVAGFVRLSLFDLLGREKYLVVNEQLKPGEYEVTWDGSNYPSGVYFYRLVTGNFIETKKMVLVK